MATNYRELIAMHNLTFTTGQRVALDGRPGTVRETTAPTVNAVLVEFDTPPVGSFTRHAFVFASDLSPMEDTGPAFAPVYDNDGETVMHYTAPDIDAPDRSWTIGVDLEGGKLLIWPETPASAPQLSPQQALDLGRALVATAERYINGPDYAALEAAWLGDPAPAPAGGDTE